MFTVLEDPMRAIGEKVIRSHATVAPAFYNTGRPTKQDMPTEGTVAKIFWRIPISFLFDL